MLTINTKTFVRELEWITRFVESKATIPILGNVILQPAAGGVTLTGTDLEIGATSHLESDGNILPITFPAAAALKYLKRVDDSELRISTIDTLVPTVECVPCVEATADSPAVEAIEAIAAHYVADSLVVEHGEDSRATFNGIHAAGFPELPTLGTTIAELNGLRQALPRVRIAISKEESRFTLCGALLDMDGGRVSLCGTDGHRLSLHNLSSPDSPKYRALIPSAALAELDRLKLDSVVLSADDNHLFFTFGTRQILARKLTGSFPDYERVMPKEYTYRAAVNTESLVKALKRVSVMADERSHAIRWTMNGRLSLEATISDSGSAAASVPVEYQTDAHPSEDWKAGYNSEYLLSALAHMPESTEYCFGRAQDAAEFTTANWRYVVMPMRV